MLKNQKTTRVMGLDVSSSCTGCAVMDPPAALVTGERFRLESEDSWVRIMAMAEDLEGVIKEYQPGEIIIEMSRGHVHGKLAKGQRAGKRAQIQGQAVLGQAQGALCFCCEKLLPGKVIRVGEEWTRRVSKRARQLWVAQQFPRYSQEKDKGSDLSDAIGLVLWRWHRGPVWEDKG